MYVFWGSYFTVKNQFRSTLFISEIFKIMTKTRPDTSLTPSEFLSFERFCYLGDLIYLWKSNNFD